MPLSWHHTNNDQKLVLDDLAHGFVHLLEHNSQKWHGAGFLPQADLFRCCFKSEAYWKGLLHILAWKAAYGGFWPSALARFARTIIFPFGFLQFRDIDRRS